MKSLFSLYQTQVQQKFFQRLDEKTGWGKEQVKQLYIEVTNELLAEILSNV